MLRTLQRALGTGLVLSLAAVGLVSTPAEAVVECTTPGVPVIKQFSMSPPTITAPAGDGVEQTTLTAQVDTCGAEGLSLRVDLQRADGEIRQLEGFGQDQAPDGTSSSVVPWEAGDVGAWNFTLVAEGTDVNGAVQSAREGLAFTVEAPPVEPPPVEPPPALTAPGKVGSVRVSKRAATSGKVSWKAPSSNGGSKITGYRVVRPGTDVTVEATARSYTIKGLKPGRSYTIKVKAKNAQGYGQSSGTTLRTLVSVPAKPGSVKVSKRTPTSGKVSWKAPSSNGGVKITGYRVVKPGTDVTVKATARSYTIKGLKPGRSYTIKVKAKNAKGYGASSSVKLKTLVSVPTKPRSLKVSKRTQTSARISWNAPSSNGGAKITGYRIVKPGADILVKATVRAYTVRGLKAGRTYTIKIKARNVQGYGPTSRIRLKTAAGASSNCTPGYSPCLPPASDYDCAGGSGDGPKYAHGPIRVTGSDPYDLDRDGDGVACESQ